MSTAPIEAISASKSPDSSTDPEIMKVKAQIHDWETCPTTDPKTKEEKIRPLQVELDSLKSSIENKAKKASEQTKAEWATTTSLYVDVST